MKHAYLIVAHSSKPLLKELIKAIDDSRNDIYIHLDKKADFEIADISTSHSGLYIITDRIDARWGDYSLVEVELKLLQEAHGRNEYGYYHIISGVDFPLKSQDYIHDFCDKHQGKQFIGFAEHTPKEEIKWRSQHYFLFSRDFKSNNFIKKSIRAIFARLQSVVDYKRFEKEVKKGCQWCSITDEFAVYLLENKHSIRKYFNHTYCPDEMFVQTMCWHSKFKNSIYNIDDEFEGCMRYIIWEDGLIHNLDNLEVSELVSSDRLFGRKFTEVSIEKFSEIKKQYSTKQL